MAHRFLVLGDHHGDTESLRRVIDDIDDETFDFAVHVGDLTNAVRDGREAAARQLERVEPLLETVADRTRHGLIWVYGNRDYFGDVPADLDVGTRAPEAGTVTVGGQRFTNDPGAVDADTVLVTHMETWSLLDHFDGRAHFCGNTHLGRYRDRRVNAAFLQYTYAETGEQQFGGYVVVEIPASPATESADPFDVEVRSVGSLERIRCPEHRERGLQFRPAGEECMYCMNESILMREMAATAFYGCTHDSDRKTVARTDVVDYAVSLWEDPPVGFEREFRAYLGDVDEDRYAPLSSTGDGTLRVAEESYAY